MIKKVIDIADRKIVKIDILTGVRRVQDAFDKDNIECFAVFEDNELAGVITKKELIGAHPNRIAADIMSCKYISVDCSTYVWRVKELFDFNRTVDTIFVKDKNEVIGYVTRATLNIELAKHIDLLTGLYKRDYIFYNAYNLIKCGRNVSLIFIDMDRFGHIDKEYGHIKGDEILKNVADILKCNLEPESYLCRYAGDEFAIVAPCCIDDSRSFAEKLANSINSHRFSNNVPVSVSIGVTGCSVQNKNISNVPKLIEELVNGASLASTKAKKSTNNLIIAENVDIEAIA